SRKTSIPLSAAEATKRRMKSASTGREPTRKRPRNARPSGVDVRLFSARIRSHGLSSPRLTAASKQPPPETSRYAKPALSRITAIARLTRLQRCAWVPEGDPLYVAYHDEEWGLPEHDERRLFELLTLEGAQAGLSWSTILHKREGYRAVFEEFDAARVARLDAE